MSIKEFREEQQLNKYNLLYWLVFLYFLTLSGDQLHLQIGFFKPKINHLLGIILFLVLFFSNQIRLLDRRLTFSVIGLLCSISISCLFSSLPTRSLGYVAILCFTYVVYFLVPLSLMQIFDRHQLLRLYLLSCVWIALHAILQVGLSFYSIYDVFLTQLPIFGVIARGQSWTYEPSFYALYLIPFVFFVNTNNLKQWRFGYLIFFNLALLVSISTSAFFSYFVFLVALLGLSCFRFRKLLFSDFFKRSIQFFGGFFLCFCGIGIYFREIFIVTYYKFFYVGFFAHYSFAARWNGIVAAWEVFKENPLFGLGLGGVAPAIYLDTYGSTAPIGLYEPSLDMIENFDPSNVFTEILASLGLLGFFVFVLMGLIFSQIFLRALRDPNRSIEDKQTIFALLLSIVIMLVCLQFNQGIFRNYVWVHMGMSLGYVLKPVSKLVLSQT